MSEQNANPANPQEKKWTEWSVVSTGDGTLRCRRTNVEDDKDAEYREVPRPAFSQVELAGLVEFGKLELLGSSELVRISYENRYRDLAFRACAMLNAEAK